MSKATQLKPKQTTPPQRNQKYVGLFGDINHWLHNEAKNRNWRIISLWHSEINLLKLDLNGIITTGLPTEDSSLIALKHHIPIVRLGRFPHPEDRKIPAFLPNYAIEGALAAEHFIERGFKNIGYFGHKPIVNETLIKGFMNRAKALGAHVLTSQFSGTKGRTSKQKQIDKRIAFQTWLKNIPKPIGILAHGGWGAANITLWTDQIGHSIPNEVAIISENNNKEICNYSMPSISYIEQDEATKVKKACDALEQLMNGSTVQTKPIFISPKGIVENESTSSKATNDKIVVQAINTISKHLKQSTPIEEIANTVGLSARQLDRRFLKALGHTTNEEIRHQRVEESKRLLITTDFSIHKIAALSGFNSTAYFNKTFKSLLNIKPSEYRLKHQN